MLVLEAHGNEGPFLPPSCGVLVGADAAYAAGQGIVVAAAVAWQAESGRVLEQHVAMAANAAPYVPGRFAEREAGAIIAALRAFSHRPMAVLCDAHGQAHPRRFGLACEVARVTGWPTIGCAKSLLCGRHTGVAAARGSVADVVLDGEVVGRVVRTQSQVRPVYVSVGGGIGLDEAVRVVLLAAPRFRLPEPLRLAHQHAAKALKRLLASANRAE
ncbi:MAG: endonuclease V [Candidatus Binatia bacterium]|nr:endonuclease V [Candidatus Binatia bacterium]